MSDIDKNTVQKIANLANIAVTSLEEDILAGELGNILDYIEQLSEVDTDNVAPLISCSEAEEVIWRNDEATTEGFTKQVLANAPESKMDFYLVPKVLDNS